MDKAENQLMKEIKQDIVKDSIVSFLLRNRKFILLIIFFIVVVIIGSISYNLYIKSNAKENSITLASIKDKITTSEDTGVIEALDSLAKDGTNGYEFIAYMEKSAFYLKNNMMEESIQTLQEAEKKISLSANYKDMIKTMEYMLRLDNDSDKEALANDIHKTLNKKSTYYPIQLELYATLLVEQKKYQEAIDYYSEIISLENTPKIVSDRAKRVRGMLYAYIN